MAFQTYKDLEIYQLSHDLAIENHKVSLRLPKFELYEEGRQLRFDNFIHRYEELGRKILNFIKAVESGHR